jgi:ribosomal protein L23
MDFNKLKLFGFRRANLRYKLYDPTKYRYLVSKAHGYFEAPKVSGNRELRFLVQQYKNKLEYEKYMNPKGLRYTVTSNFPKVGETIDYPDPKFFLTRTDKLYANNSLKFEIDDKLSKPEIQQFFEKVYQVPVKKVRTSILPGEVKAQIINKNRRYIRTSDKKKALLEFDFDVDRDLRQLELPEKKIKNKQNKKHQK